VQYVVKASDFVRRDGEGEVVFDTRQADGPPEPTATLWSDPIPSHSLENVGDAELCVIMVELKGRPAGPASDG
jgi:hypothetical protein